MASALSRPAPGIGTRAKVGALVALGIALLETVAKQPSAGDLLIDLLADALEKLSTRPDADPRTLAASWDWLIWLADQVEVVRNECEKAPSRE